MLTFVIVFVIGSAVLHGTITKLGPPDKGHMVFESV